MHFSGVLFDKDGTLFDFHATWGDWAYGFLMKLSGGDMLRMQLLSNAIEYDPGRKRFLPGSPAVAGTPGEIAERLLPHLPGTTPSALITHINRTAAVAPMTEAAPLLPLLGRLRSQGIKLGCVTNDAEVPARAHLKSAGICDLLDYVVGFDSGYGAKPDAGPLLGFCDRMDLRPDQVLMVGDSRHDLIAARAAGMCAVGVLTGLATQEELAPLADAVLPDVGGLPAWLNDLEQVSTAAQ
ncbi:HAD family hydrolase [Cognatishimia sp. MH4019]|uniref:HAD family hydrolase n=1 Tax=Cognatishimia sp. MH4019 TaxID=2854030 RepID=UPI001CD364CB|nr:HAD family hydrolase [Cognatishimia sp. MH4019]